MAIRPTTSEKSRSRVYCRSATPSNSSSRAVGGKAIFRVARAMTVTGDSATNRSKASLRIMAVASVESKQLLGRRQLIKLFNDLHRAGSAAPTRILSTLCRLFGSDTHARSGSCRSGRAPDLDRDPGDGHRDDGP